MTNQKRKNVDTSSSNKAIRINPKHEDMLELSLWSPNHSATPSSSPSEFPTPSQWQLSLSPLSSSSEFPITTTTDGGAVLPPLPAAQPNPNPNPSPPSPSREEEGEGSEGEGEGQGEEGQGQGDSDSETIGPPYEWATDRPAIVHTLEHLLSHQIEKIKGVLKCKRCECQYEMEYDLRDKFSQLEELIWENKDEMYERAPEIWKNPTLPRCRYCHQDNSAKPVIGKSKKAINWLFLLLGQLVGCCTLDQLKYFCGHTKNHRTGAKDRLLYLVYLTLCKQLRPNDPNFHR